MYAPQQALAPYDPAHRAPRRPEAKFTPLGVEGDIDRRVQADLDRIDRELAGTSSDGVGLFSASLDEYARQTYGHAWVTYDGGKTWHMYLPKHSFPFTGVTIQSVFAGVSDYRNMTRRGQRKQKTYTAPGKRDRMSWVARNQQRKEAKRR